jgi:hypothetical protein
MNTNQNDKSQENDDKNNENNNEKQFETNNLLNKLNDVFKLPIYYNEKKVEIKENIVKDLELINNQTNDSSCNPIYTFLFNNDNDVSIKINEQFAKYYTTDINYLKENQKLLQEYIPIKNKYKNKSKNYQKIIDIWSELKIESGFKEKYYYVDWEILEWLNTSEFFLQFMSLYNLFSPIFSLLMPLLLLIVPFLIIKVKGLDISIEHYCAILKVLAQTNSIGKLLTANFNEIPFQDQIYIFVSAGFYLFSIYQNIMVCIRFHKNMIAIHDHFKEIKIYLNDTINRMQNYISYSDKFNTHKIFNDLLKEKLVLLKDVYFKLSNISEYKFMNLTKIKEIGTLLKYFYQLHTDKTFDNLILYSIGFNGYIDCIEGLQENILEGKINYASFINKKSKKSNKSVFKNNYYACLKNESPIKNTIHFNNNLIITGPNASGKTTILKSVLINIIFTQQFGCAFYDSAKFKPFDHIHCYLNIPDTSGRDSLFQAEARRCKEIIDYINNNKTDTHFCAFDEIYSGTNPEEAENSASSFMLYLQKYKKVFSILTTHFINVCKKLENIDGIINCKMRTMKQNNILKYMYKLEPGISDVKGGINVLTEMNYPKEIIDNIL